jgi:hypothetical protein
VPVILATWKAKIKRIMVPGQPRQKVLEIPPHPSTNSWVQWFMPVNPATREAEMGRVTVLGQSKQKSLCNPISMKKSWAWWCISVIPVTVGCIK